MVISVIPFCCSAGRHRIARLRNLFPPHWVLPTGNLLNHKCGRSAIGAERSFQSLVYILGCAYLYRVHVVLPYAADVKNLIIKILRMRFWGKNKTATSLY